MANVDVFAGARLPRSPVYGMRGMVVSGHSLASLAGMRVLEQGGSLADAMIATSAVLTVTIPQATSTGGDAFILYHDAATGKTVGLNASGHAPAGATPEAFAGGMKVRGPLAASVPGMIRGWEALHQCYGKLPWKGLFAAAIDLAAHGHPLSRVLAAGLRLFHADVSADPGLSALYMPGGVPLNAGDVVRQPALAETLSEIAEKGAGAYYEGRIAKSIGDYSRSRGGLLSAGDFAGYQPEWVTPLETTYRGLTVRVMPPNSYGVLMLMQLNALSGLSSEELAGASTAQRLAWLMAAARATFAAGEKFIADPRTDPAPLDDMLGARQTQELQHAVRTLSNGTAGGGKGGTSCIVMADKDGNACSVVQSVFHVFGSAFMDPGTGILLNNRMTGFTHKPGLPRSVAPGKRPPHTLNPTMTLDGGKPRYLLTTPGGPAQTISLIQVLTGLVDLKRELSTCVEGPRWSIDLAGRALVELGYDDATLAELGRLGYPTGRAEGASYFGSIKAIEVMKNGVLAGMADMRREAYAVGA